jgi:hypothetical protein
MGVDFAKAALAAGNAVVATGRDSGTTSPSFRDRDCRGCEIVTLGSEAGTHSNVSTATST